MINYNSLFSFRYPRISMCWAAKTRVPVIPNSMSCNRFFQIMQSVKSLMTLISQRKRKKICCLEAEVSLQGATRLPQSAKTKVGLCRWTDDSLHRPVSCLAVFTKKTKSHWTKVFCACQCQWYDAGFWRQESIQWSAAGNRRESNCFDGSLSSKRNTSVLS